ncbi:MAG: hypothetical protein WBD20_15355 [Pirellulaceae bacterium]
MQTSTMDGSPTKTTLAQREESLRRVAIVLSSLPAPTASRLLENIDGYSRHIVQQAMETLHTVAPHERHEILGSFKNRITGDSQTVKTPAAEDFAASPTEGIQDEIVLGQSATAKVLASPLSHQYGDRYGEQVAAFFPATKSDAKATCSPFQFLDNVSVENMVSLLSGEHPQTIALVLSSIPPKRAADILPQLNASLQKQTLSRIGRLSDVPESTAAEVSQHLQSRYQETIHSVTETSGKRALQAIMAELPGEAMQSSCTATRGQNAVAPVAAIRAAEIKRPESTPELRIAEGTQPAEQFIRSTQPEAAVEVDHDPKNARPDADVQHSLTAATHQHLVTLPSKELVAALGRVSTRDALLTLCGLPHQIAESAIALLPRVKAKQVRRGIETLGGLQLREIDEAKRAVAMVSIGAESDLFLSARAA